MKWLDAKGVRRRIGYRCESVAHAQWLIDNGHLKSRNGKVSSDVLDRTLAEWGSRGSDVPRVSYGVKQHMLNCNDKYGRLLSVEEAAEIAGVGVATVWRRIEDGTLATVTFGEAEAAAFVRITEAKLRAAMPLARKRGRKPKAHA